MTYYELLEIAENASDEIIKAAYRAQMKKYHPDVFVGDPAFAEAKTKQINTAYQVLSDPEKRRQYDMFLASRRSTDNYNTFNETKSIYDNSTVAKRTNISFAKIKPILIIVAIIAIIVLIVGCPQKDPDDDLTPLAEPKSGTILFGDSYKYGSEITVTASKTQSCVVKLKNRSGVTKLSFYVRAGATVTVKVPEEYLYVYFASGTTWYGREHLFGSKTNYSMDDEVCDFTRYTWEYTLYPVNDGNFSQTPIDEDEFK